MANWTRDVLCVVLGLTCLAAVSQSQATQAQVNAACTSGVDLASHPSDCGMFVKCIATGVGLAMPCPGILWFDNSRQQCWWRSQVSCGNAPNPQTWSQPKCWYNSCRRGTCVEDVNNSRGYRCECWYGYTGENCSYDIDECAVSNPCQNGGVCRNARGTYVCDCPSGFTGANCITSTLG